MTKRDIQPETLSRLRTLQTGSVEQAKEYARVVKKLDEETAGMAARELRQLLQERYGLDLREEKINRSRYIGRLLYALDPEGNPAELEGIDDAETLYLIQRLHEVKGASHATILTALRGYQKTLSAAQIRQRMKDGIAMAQNRTTSSERVVWRQPLMRVPGDLCDAMNTTFAAFAKAQGATQQQAAEAMVDLLSQPLSQLPLEVSARLGQALESHAKASKMTSEEAATALATLLERLDSQAWGRLYALIE